MSDVSVVMETCIQSLQSDMTAVTETLQAETDTLIKATESSLLSLTQLCATEEKILKDVHDQEHELCRLRELETHSQAVFLSLNGQMSSLAETLAECSKHMKSLQDERDSLQRIITEKQDSEHVMQVEYSLHAEQARLAGESLQSVEVELRNAVMKRDMLAKSKDSLEDIVQGLRRRTAIDTTFWRQTQCQLAGAQEQLDNLENDCNQQTRLVETLLEKAQRHRSQQEQCQSALDAFRGGMGQRQRSLQKDAISAKNSHCLVDMHMSQAIAKQRELHANIAEVQRAIDQHKRSEYRLHTASARASSRLEILQAEHSRFFQAADNISQELLLQRKATSSLAHPHSSAIHANNTVINHETENASTTMLEHSPNRGIEKLQHLLQAVTADRKSIIKMLLTMLALVVEAEASRYEYLIASEAQRAKVERLTACRKELLMKLRMKENETVHLDEQVISLKIDVEAMTSRNGVLECSLAQINGALQVATEAKIACEVEIAEKSQSNQLIKEQLRAKTEELGQLALIAADHAEHVRQLSIELKAEKSSRAHSDSVLAGQRAQSAALRTQLDSQTKQAIDLTVKLRKLRGVGQARTDSISNQEASDDTNGQVFDEYEGRYAHIQQQNRDLSRKTTELEARAQSQEKTNADLRQRLQILQQQLNESNRRVEQLQRMHPHERIATSDEEQYRLQESLFASRPVTPAQSSDLRPSSSLSGLSVSCAPGRNHVHNIESSPTVASLEPDSLLWSSSCPSSSPSRADTLFSLKAQDHRAEPQSTSHPSRHFDGELSSKSDGRSHEPESTGLQNADLAVKSGHVRGQKQNTIMSGITSSSTRYLNAAANNNHLKFMDDVEDKSAWAAKHPRLWKLVYGKRGPSERAVSA